MSNPLKKETAKFLAAEKRAKEAQARACRDRAPLVLKARQSILKRVRTYEAWNNVEGLEGELEKAATLEIVAPELSDLVEEIGRALNKAIRARTRDRLGQD